VISARSTCFQVKYSGLILRFADSLSRIGQQAVALLIVLLAISRYLAADPFEQGMLSLKKGDFAEAFCVWKPLAAQGHTDAAYHLGWLYANGYGLRVDSDKAVHWWTEAAKRGHLEATFALGLAYLNGERVGKNLELSLNWLIRAAEAGHDDAREIVRSKVRSRTKETAARLSELVKHDWLGTTLQVSVDRANLRSGPGTRNERVDMLEKDDMLIAIGKQGDWYQVIKSDDLIHGWIADWLIQKIEPQPDGGEF
jgi:TPR repeat protein